MNLRFHWIVGTAILVTVCGLPLLLWLYGLYRPSWVATLFFVAVAVISLLALLVKRVFEAFEKTLHDTSHADAQQFSEIPEDIFCPACSYNLFGAPSERCPECGYSLTNIRSRTCRIPWIWRKELGRFRAYWATIWMVTFRNRRFCEEYSRSLGYTEARSFQWATVLHAYLPLLAATVIMYTTPAPKAEPMTPFQQMMTTGVFQRGPTALDRAYVEVWPVAILHVCFLLFLAAATGVASYFFHPRSVSVQRQNAAIAMSYYTCGPLALTVLPVLALWSVLEHGRIDRWHAQEGFLFAGLATFVIAAAWWSNVVRTARRIMPQLKNRRALLAVSLPLLWLALAGLILVGLPFVVLAIAVIVATLS